MKILPNICPACQSQLSITKLRCGACETEVSGSFEMPILTQLHVDDQEFILEFFMYSGSLKEMASKMGKSYPTVRNKLDDLIEKIKVIQRQT